MELSWRGRARELENELLRTRQELVMCRLEAAATTREGVGQAAWPSSGYSSVTKCSGSVAGEAEEGMEVAVPTTTMGGGVGDTEGSGLAVSVRREGCAVEDTHLKFYTSGMCLHAESPENLECRV